MDHARAIGLRCNPEVSRITLLIQLFALRREQDRQPELDAILSREAISHPTESLWQCLLAVLMAEDERYGEASEIIDHLLDNGTDAIPRDSYWLASQALIADAYARVGDTRHAAALLPILDPYSRLFISPGNDIVFFGPVSHYLGRLSATLERWADAATYYEEALAAEKKARIPVFEGHTEYAYGEMLVRRGSRDAATPRIERAREISKQFALKRLERQVGKLRAQLDACHSP
jgi:tetratricopeptide (TPR) repeat protein